MRVGICLSLLLGFCIMGYSQGSVAIWHARKGVRHFESGSFMSLELTDGNRVRGEIGAIGMRKIWLCQEVAPRQDRPGHWYREPVSLPHIAAIDKSPQRPWAIARRVYVQAALTGGSLWITGLTLHGIARQRRPKPEYLAAAGLLMASCWIVRSLGSDQYRLNRGWEIRPEPDWPPSSSPIAPGD